MPESERLPRSTGTADGTAYRLYGPDASAGSPGTAAMVLIHGVGMQQDVWAPQVAALAGERCVLTYDLLGHGASRLPREDATLGDYAGQLLALLDHLRLGLVDVVGHSMGALVALEFALSHPQRTRRVVAMNAVFRRSAEQRAAVRQRAQALQRAGVDATIDGTIERWFGDPPPAPLAATARQVRGFLADVDPIGYARTYRIFAESDEVHQQRLRQLAMPALFTTGEFDGNSTPAMSAAMAELAPQGRLDVVAGARHMMNLTDVPRVNGMLREFLCADAGAGAGTRATVGG